MQWLKRLRQIYVNTGPANVQNIALSEENKLQNSVHTMIYFVSERQVLHLKLI